MNFEKGDIKYYWGIHKQRMEELGEEPVCYSIFWNRLNSGMTLHDAIYYPAQVGMRRKLKEDNREDIRKARLIEEGIIMNGERLETGIWSKVKNLFRKSK